MQKTISIPKTSEVFSALLRADFTTQWRNRRSFVIILIVPLIILTTWKGFVVRFGGPFVLSNCITVGLNAIGLMGYANSIARDRDKGIFQRLRVAPLPKWAIMTSRLSVQLAMICLLTIITYIGGKYSDDVTLSVAGYTLTFITAFLGGAVYLCIGQMIVGLIKNPETVNSTARLIYLAFIMVGMFGQFGAFGKELQTITVWSPYGTVQTILAAGMTPATWNNTDSLALLATVGYTILFAIIGIQKFQWSSR